jgi:Protein of unknown function (DUF2815)
MPALQTCVGTISYPHLFKARPRAEGNPEMVYSTVLLLDDRQMKSPAYAEFKKAIDDFARQAFPKLVLGKGLQSPFRLCEEKENFPQEYKIFFNAWSKNPPGVVDNARNRIADSNEVWAGQHARLFVNPFAWEHSGKKGISLGLQHVQIVKSEGLKRLDGRKPPEESFDDEFDDAEDDV